MEKKYSLENQKGKNTFYVKVWGFFKEEDAKGFIEDYNKIIKDIKPSKYTLIVDSTGLKTSSQDMLPLLQKCLEFYMKDNFNKIYLVNPEDVLCKTQLQRVAKKINFSGDFVDSVDNIQ